MIFFINPQLSQVRQSGNHKSANFSPQDRENGTFLLKSFASFMAKHSSAGLISPIFFLFTTNVN
jgi:hypothetical protein